MKWKQAGITSNGLFLVLIFFQAPAFGVTPMEYYNSLVAGGDDAGFQDGVFNQAQFNHPSGLAFDVKGSRLFVADKDNHRIRVIHLDEDNRVDTLAGTGKAGKEDGPLATASFNQPTALAWIPPNQLAVYDEGSQLLRLVDLEVKTVTTLGISPEEKNQATTLEGIWNLVYWPIDDSLYFSRPASHVLQRMELKIQKISLVFANDPRLPSPKALCVSGDKLYAADQDSDTIYEVGPESTGSPVSLVKAGKGKHVLELTVSDGILYALQTGDAPLAEVAPEYRPVSLATPWGFMVDNQNPGAPPLLQFNLFRPAGVAAWPLEPRKIFIAGSGTNEVISVKDYQFEKTWGARSVTQMGVLSDFEYPTTKPPKTFRILIVGNSRIMTAPTIIPGAEDVGSKVDVGAVSENSLRTNTFPKQLEFLLNEQAALKGVDVHFEVLALGHPGKPTHFFSYYEVPVLTQKYDADLVFLLVSPLREQQYSDYFLRPLNSEGVPAQDDDPEYILKPFSKRIPGGTPRSFLEHGKKLGLFRVAPSGQVSFPFFGDLLQAGDNEIRDDLIELTGRPLGLLARKMEGVKTSSGTPVKFFLCYSPALDTGPLLKGAYESFWKDLCAKEKLDLMDLTGPYNALQTSFYPVNEACCHNHYTAYGNLLMATLLGYYLPEQKWIPFEPTHATERSSK